MINDEDQSPDDDGMAHVGFTDEVSGVMQARFVDVVSGETRLCTYYELQHRLARLRSQGLPDMESTVALETWPSQRPL